jgi:hypothetical protein
VVPGGNRATVMTSPMIVAAITGPAPNTLVTVVPVALTAAASFFFTSRRWPSRWRMPSSSSAASSQRAWPAAPAGRIWARIFPARPAVICTGTPPGTSSHSTACSQQATWL